MTTRNAKSKIHSGGRDPVRDGLVLAAMAVVVLALAIGLNVQFGLTIGLAVVAALSIYVALVSMHVLVRRSDHLDTLRRDVSRLEGQLARGVGASAPFAAAPLAVVPVLADAIAAAPLPPVGNITLESGVDQAVLATAVAAQPAETISLDDYWTFRPVALDAPAPPEAMALDADKPAQQGRHAVERTTTSDWSGIESAAWATVPGSTGRDLPAIVVAEPALMPLPVGASGSAATAEIEPALPVAEQQGGDLEKINVIIKKLAADINAGHGGFHSMQAASVGGQLVHDMPPELGTPASVSQPPMLPPALPANQEYGQAASLIDARDVEASIEALQAVASVMREAGQPQLTLATGPAEMPVLPPAAMSRPVAPPPLPVTAVDQRLVLIADALKRERVDVLLDPILGLGDRRAQHFEVTVRLKADAAALSVLDTRGMRGSGLLPLFDAIRLERSARIAWRMDDRGKAGSLFTEMAGESLVNDRFLNRFADTYRQGEAFSRRLVLSFSQADLRTFSEPQWLTLREMKDLGFRFCLEDVTDLDLDFEALASNGFAFVKLDAPVFLEGLMVANGSAVSTLIPPADICRHFGQLGLDIIVGEISDEQQSANVAACGVALGQGTLFGEPRPVKADVLREPHPQMAVA